MFLTPTPFYPQNQASAHNPWVKNKNPLKRPLRLKVERRSGIRCGLKNILGGKMARQKIPRIQPSMIKTQPDQVCAILNAVIDKINTL